MIARAGARVTAVAQDARGQARNRELALERLRRRLTQALATPRRPAGDAADRGGDRGRLDTKRRQAARKRDRQRPKNDD